MVKNDSAFHSGSRNLCAASRTSRAEKRDGCSGLLTQKYQRRASAPVSSITAHRLDDVAQPLRHLAALLVVDVAEHDAVS